MRTARLLLLTFALGASSCLYTALGVEHNRVAADGLRVGMSREQCIDALARGGSIVVRRELPLEPERDRAATLHDEAALASLRRAEQDTGQHAVRAVVVDRHWGFMGFGVFHLFLCGRDQLVGHHLHHVN